MSKKKIWLTFIIVIVAVASVLGVTYAAWVEFTSKPTGNWEVNAVVPKDLTITKTVADTAPYMGHNGSEGEVFISNAAVTMTANKNMAIVGKAVVKCMKDGQEVAIAEDKAFVVVFFDVNNNHITSVDLVAHAETIVKIGVIFPDLSDTKYQKSAFTVKVDISEKAVA